MGKTRIVLLVVGALALLSSCAEVSGGGSIRSASGGKNKATYGFDVTCDTTTDPEGVLVGSWVYHDKAGSTSPRYKPVDVGGTLTAAMNIPCEPQLGPTGGFGVWFLPYGKQGTGCTDLFSGCEGIASVTVYDANVGGPASVKGDGLGIYLNGGRFDGYYNGTGTPFSFEGFYLVEPRPILGGNLEIVCPEGSPSCTSSYYQG